MILTMITIMIVFYHVYDCNYDNYLKCDYNFDYDHEFDYDYDMIVIVMMIMISNIISKTIMGLKF